MKTRETPDLFYEQLLLKELPVGKQEELNNAFSEEKIDSIKESNIEILNEYTPEKIGKEIREKLNKDKILPFTGQVRYISLAAAVLVLVFAGAFPFIIQKDQADRINIGLEGTRVKGTSYIQIYKNTDNNAELLSDGSFAEENDLLQISYTSLGKKYGTIFSIDGNGVVTLHYPKLIEDSVQLENDGETALEWSYKLDNAPAYEKFFFVTSKNEFSVEDVLYYAYTLAESGNTGNSDWLGLPKEYDQFTLTLKKGDN